MFNFFSIICYAKSSSRIIEREAKLSSWNIPHYLFSIICYAKSSSRIIEREAKLSSWNISHYLLALEGCW